MSIFARSFDLFNRNRTILPDLDRRSLLGLLPAWLIAPRTSARARATLPKGTIRASGPDSRRLDGLLAAYRATWPAEAEARHAMDDAVERGEHYKPWLDAYHRAEHPRNSALSTLCDAVLEVSGIAKPEADQWERFGSPIALVATEGTLYIISPSMFAEYIEDPDDFGMVELTMIDL